MVRIGIVGVGGIANGAHIPQILQANGGKLVAICDIDESRLEQTGDRYDIPREYRFKNYIDLINCDIVDAVEVCTPNHMHVPIALEVIKAGKPVNVEKPLSVSYDAANVLEDYADDSSVKSMMCFSYRFRPAVRYAKEIIEKGRLGDIVSVNVEYLKSSAFWQGRRLEWRFIKEYAGTGVLGDLGVHMIDMARYLVGEFDSVCAKTSITVKERMKLDSDELGQVETDDTCNFLVDFKNGASGIFAITRCALGNDNTIKYAIYGTRGVITFNLNNPDELSVCLDEVDIESNGLHTIKAPARFNLSQEQAFIDLVAGKRCADLPDIKEGLRCQKILDALLYSSEHNTWVKL